MVGDPVNTWTDRISNVVMTCPGPGPAPIDFGVGVFFNSQSSALTNPPITLGSNFSVWVVYRPNTNYTTTNYVTILGDTNGYGLVLSNSIIHGFWGVELDNSSTVSLLNRGAPIDISDDDYVNPTAPVTYDIVDSGGAIYTNGVSASGGIGEPTNNFLFEALGNITNQNNVNGLIQYIGIWTNYTLTSSDVSNLDNWVDTNGVTNVTGGLLAWYKLNEGSGTNIYDSSGNGYDGQVVGTANWTNGVINGGFYFTGNNYIITTNLANNLPEFTVTFWASGNNFSSSPTGAVTGGYAFVSEMALVVPPVLGGLGPGDGSPTFTGWAVGGDNGGDCFGGMYCTNGFVEGGRPQIQQYDSTWHFMAITFTNSTNQSTFTYLDGAYHSYYQDGPFFQNGTTNLSISNPAPLIIGSDTYQENLNNCSLCDVRIYNRVLTAQEIAILYRWRGQP